MHVWKNNTDGQSLPRMGKVASATSRIGCWRYEKERNEIDNAYVLKYAVNESTLSAPAGHLPLEGKAAIREYHHLKKGSEAATRALNPEPNESKVKRSCEEMNPHFFTAPFLLSYFG